MCCWTENAADVCRLAAIGGVHRGKLGCELLFQGPLSLLALWRMLLDSSYDVGIRYCLQRQCPVKATLRLTPCGRQTKDVYKLRTRWKVSEWY
jgi:hypothetical protein